MKILHIAESAQGGVGTYLVEMLPSQAEVLGAANVRALVPDRHGAHLTGVDRRQIATWRRGGRSIAAAVALALALRREVRAFRPTIVHAHSSIAGFLVRLIYGWRPRQFSIVYCPHGWAFERQGSVGVSRVIKAVERLLASAADRIITISEHEHSAALRIGIPADRLYLVLNGVADQHVPTLPARWDGQRLKVLFVGRLDQQKGLDTLLDAVEPLGPRVSLRVIGKAVAGEAPVRTGNRSQVEFLGWRTAPEISAEIAAADLVAVPSRWEGFGLVAIEAMRGGRAVLASSVGGLPEIVVDGLTGRLVAPDSPERLMQALTEHDRASWQAMGRAGRARYETMFTAERMNRELLAVYRGLPARSSSWQGIPVFAHA